MATSSTVYPNERRELTERYALLSRKDKEKLSKPYIGETEHGMWVVTHPNFAYHYSTAYIFEDEASARAHMNGDNRIIYDRVTSYHWGDSYSEKGMLALMNERLGGSDEPR